MTEHTVREFHRLYHDRGLHAFYGRGLHAETRYHGYESHKCPLDLWIFQEVLHDVRPGLVVEIGTYLGGTTLFLAHQLELFGQGRVLSIDNRELPRPTHGRIEYLLGNSQDQQILTHVRAAAAAVGPAPVLVIHDGDHECAAALADLEAYAPLVTPGSYLIVEDTNLNGHPVLVDWGPGPWEAVESFLKLHREFQQDRSREKFLMTYNPGGYLRRIS